MKVPQMGHEKKSNSAAFIAITYDQCYFNSTIFNEKIKVNEE